jgi:hypothetical protein
MRLTSLADILGDDFILRLIPLVYDSVQVTMGLEDVYEIQIDLGGILIQTKNGKTLEKATQSLRYSVRR